jgi:hypothetical protein
MGILVNCSNPSCKKEIEKSPCHLKRTKNSFCGNECRIEFMKGRGMGKDNPNYGKKWGKERKEKQSEIIKSRIDDEYRKNCSKGMKGRSVSEETKKKRKETLLERYGSLSNTHSFSDESKKIIGEKSRQKFTEEFKAKFYQTMVERGIWTAKEDLDPYKFYREISNWNCNVLRFGIIGGEKIKDFGFYNGKTNKNGLVRDHRFSRKSGFDLGIFPEILRHPVNCELISHGDNIRKRQSKSINADSISAEDLFVLIKNFEGEYQEHDLCLEKIKDYEGGKRYERSSYIH